MQRRIQSLPTQLANQIAAGEVVERPASVVKELLENSIDAGACRIALELEQGGVRLIRVQDDGGGIHRDDLLLAASPHATSKVYSQRELEEVASLGFRGEALASIASVCRFTLSSRQGDSGEGWQVEGDGRGAMRPPQPCAMPSGTRVEVRDLFYNTPARRKFLRSERTEYLHIEEVLKRLALSRYDIAFELSHNGRQQLRLRAVTDVTRREQRVAEVLGRAFVQHARQLAFEAAGMRLWGWLGEPGYSRSQADAQYFYLNGRMIRDKLVSHAIRQAHQASLEPGRHPAYLLYLEVDPGQVDVNVHPTKHEVRFRESRLVHDFVVRALSNTLCGESVAQAPRVDNPPPSVWGGGSLDRSPAMTPRAIVPARVAEQGAFYAPRPAPPQRPRAVPAPRTDSLGRVLAVLHERFLLVAAADGPRVIALAEARALLLSRRLQEMVEDGEVQSQPLLIPATVNLHPDALVTLLRQAPQLLRLGLVVERLGEGAVVVRQLPLLLRGAGAGQILEVVVRLLQQQEEPFAVDDLQTLQRLAAALVPLLPLPALGEAELLLHELHTLIVSQRLDAQELPWQPLPPEALQQLFSPRR